MVTLLGSTGRTVGGSSGGIFFFNDRFIYAGAYTLASCQFYGRVLRWMVCHIRRYQIETATLSYTNFRTRRMLTLFIEITTEYCCA
jgi:hypothetical protein